MACFFPWKAYRHRDYRPGAGVPFLTINTRYALNADNPILMPCNVCNGCISDRKISWGIRCYHEAKFHAAEGGNAFITLTFDNEHYPDHGSVNLRTLQLFMKRLRKEVARPLRFYGCGEYGDETKRAHYHALIFGWDFRLDRYTWRNTKHGPIYRSPRLEKAWGFGNCELGTVTYKSARYVAGYVDKKIKNRANPSAYEHVHPITGELVRVSPEFASMSGKPGIGYPWFNLYKNDYFPSDHVVIDGKKLPVPPYYLRKLAEESGLSATDPAPPAGPIFTLHQKEVPTLVSRKRKRNALKRKDDNTPARLMVRAEIHDRKLGLSKRTI